MTQRLILLTTEGESGKLTARFLAARFADLVVIVEEPEPRTVFMRRRIKRLGVITVAGQILFMIWQRLQQARSRKRIETLRARFDRPAQVMAVHHVESVNGADCVALLRRLHPAAVLVMGTRIIAPEVLQSVDAPFINYHAGITPKYRGVHGGYWALATDDVENFGATVHLVDAGIDSGRILYQARGKRESPDNFSTYPYVQMGLGLPLLARAAEDALAGKLKPLGSDLPSQLWSHPTLWGYWATGLRRCVW